MTTLEDPNGPGDKFCKVQSANDPVRFDTVQVVVHARLCNCTVIAPSTYSHDTLLAVWGLLKSARLHRSYRCDFVSLDARDDKLKRSFSRNA